MIYKAILGMFLGVAGTAWAMLPTPDAPMQELGIGSNKVRFVQAQDNQALSSAVYGFLVQAEQLLPITAQTPIRSGDVVEYHAYFTNQSQARIRSMTADIEIPQGTELLGNISPRGAMASTDGVVFGFVPLHSNVNGQVQPVPLAYYKTLRWQLEDIGIGGTAVVQYRVRIK